MPRRSNRRSFLALTGTGATAALAGCASLRSQFGNDGGGEDADGSDSSETESTLTVQVQPDREELVAFREDLQAEMDEGETSQEDAQRALQSKQTELTEEAVNAYEGTAEDDDAVTVEESEPEYGILRVEAPATTFVRALEDGEVAAILPRAYYEQFLQQQQMQRAMTEGQGNATTTE